MHISLEHIGLPLEVGTKISVFWKEDDDWCNGLIDAYDPISNVHGLFQLFGPPIVDIYCWEFGMG